MLNDLDHLVLDTLGRCGLRSLVFFYPHKKGLKKAILSVYHRHGAQGISSNHAKACEVFLRGSFDLWS